MPDRGAASKSCRLPARQCLPQFIGHSRRGWLACLGLGLTAAKWVRHLCPLDLGVHGQEQFRHWRAPRQIGRPAQPPRGHRVEPVNIAAVFYGTYAAGPAFPVFGPFGLYSATR